MMDAIKDRLPIISSILVGLPMILPRLFGGGKEFLMWLGAFAIVTATIGCLFSDIYDLYMNRKKTT